MTNARPWSMCIAVPVLIAMSAGCTREGSERGIEYVPAASVPRLTGSPLEGDDIGLVREFDLVGDTLYLLDRTGRVIVAKRGASGWRIVHSFGREGGGPGEFLTPTGISANRDEVVVVDNARVQRFTRAGELTTFTPLHLPCAMTLASIAHSRAGLFVHGGCTRGGFAADTLKAVLAWSADGMEWRIVAEDVRYTRDGKVGHIFAAANALSTSDDGYHLFGTGASDCIWTIDDTGSPPSALRSCGIAGQLYSADPPPGLRERLAAGAIGGTSMSWPATLPVYVEHSTSSGGTVLVRPFTVDSVVLQRTLPDGRDIAVAPLDGLIGCKAAGCLWIIEGAEALRLIVLDRAALNELIEAGRFAQAAR